MIAHLVHLLVLARRDLPGRLKIVTRPRLQGAQMKSMQEPGVMRNGHQQATLTLPTLAPARKQLRPKGQTFKPTVSAPEEDRREMQLKANGSQWQQRTQWSNAERAWGRSGKWREQKM